MKTSKTIEEHPLFSYRSPIENLKHYYGIVYLFVKRDDKIHPKISGNKWRKLKYNLLKINELEQTQLLTFGGAFSNHIAAVAAIGKEFKLKTIGLIRGEKIEPLNPTLSFAVSCGMHLKFISRSDYRRKNEADFLEKLQREFGDFYALPEGGSNELAVKGCEEIVYEVEQQLNGLPDYFCVCCGTGGTIAGLIAALKGRSKVIGFSALKGDFLQEEVERLLAKCGVPNYGNWHINSDYHFGGYAKWNEELVTFINKMKVRRQLPLDPIYTGKMFFGIYDLLKKEYFEEGSTVLAVHSGGLQGIEGFNRRFGDLLE